MIDSKPTFQLNGIPNKRIVFRSFLEAKWALFFDHLHFNWSYEPQTFELPNGSHYTPDFYLEGIGWVEIKPNVEKLLEVKNKLLLFSCHKEKLIPQNFSNRFFSISSSFPTFDGRHTVVEWLPNKFISGGMKFAVDTICSPHFVEFKNQFPNEYIKLIDKTFEEVRASRRNGFFSMKEILFYVSLDMGATFNDSRQFFFK